MSKPSRIGSDPLDDLLPGKPRASGRPSTVHRLRSTKVARKPGPAKKTAAKPAPAAPASGSWDATHERVTFHCPRAIIDAVEAEVTRSKRAGEGRSKSRIIVDAIRQHLKIG